MVLRGHAGDAAAREALSSEPDHLPQRLWWLMAALTLVWGFNWTAIKVALSGVPPWTFRALCLGLRLGGAVPALKAGGNTLGGAAGPVGTPRGCSRFFNITCWNMLVAFGLIIDPFRARGDPRLH